MLWKFRGGSVKLWEYYRSDIRGVFNRINRFLLGREEERVF